LVLSKLGFRKTISLIGEPISLDPILRVNHLGDQGRLRAVGNAALVSDHDCIKFINEMIENQPTERNISRANRLASERSVVDGS
jgi:hypothetical protein